MEVVYTSPEEVLREAANIIDDAGWEKYVYATPYGVCAGYAITVSCYEGPSYLASEQELLLHSVTLMALRNFVGTGVTNWNDNVAASKEEVVKTLRDCAAKIESTPPGYPRWS